MSLASKMISSEMKPSSLLSSTTGRKLQRNSSIHTIALWASSDPFRGGIMWLIRSSAIISFVIRTLLVVRLDLVLCYQKVCHQLIKRLWMLHHGCMTTFVYKLKVRIGNEPVKFMGYHRRSYGIVQSPHQQSRYFYKQMLSCTHDGASR